MAFKDHMLTAHRRMTKAVIYKYSVAGVNDTCVDADVTKPFRKGAKG